MQHNVNLAPVHVEPIRVQMDVNVNVHESADSEDATSGGEEPAETPSTPAGG